MLIAAIVGLVFGAADQYLGSLRPMVVLGSWTVSVSQMSALWLLAPFLVGSRQRSAHRAAVAGLVATAFGLLGYALMTASPIETVPVHEAPHAVAAWAGSNLTVIIGGLVTGPVFGYLGHRWRSARSWVSVIVVAGAFVFEPLARVLSGRLMTPTWVWALEAVLGLALAMALAAGLRRPAAT